jgi:hypothetical protein
VGGREKFQKIKKRNWMWGGEEIKFPKKNLRSGGKKNWEGGGEKIKLQKKVEIRAEKRQTKNVNLGCHRDRKDCTIHPHWCTGGCRVTLAVIRHLSSVKNAVS